MKSVESHRIKLSAIDKNYIGSRPMVMLFRFAESLDPELIYAALYRTMGRLPLFSSQIVRDGEELYLQHEDGLFVFNELDAKESWASSVSEVASFSFADLSGVVDDSAAELDAPLTSVTVAPEAHSTLLSVSISHAVGDGMSLKVFAFVLAQAIKGLPMAEVSLQRCFPFQRDAREPQATDTPPPRSEHLHRRSGPARQARVELLTMPADDVDALQHRVNAGEAALPCSKSDVFTAWALKKVLRLLPVDGDTIRFKVPIDMRAVSDKVDASYVGNAYYSAHFSFGPAELEAMSVEALATTFRRRISKWRDPTFLDRRIVVADGAVQRTGFSSSRNPLTGVVISNLGDVSATNKLLSLSGALVLSADPNALVVRKKFDKYYAQLQVADEPSR